jgi:hypothetical protein
MTRRVGAIITFTIGSQGILPKNPRETTAGKKIKLCETHSSAYVMYV